VARSNIQLNLNVEVGKEGLENWGTPGGQVQKLKMVW